jgi:hypothetical protein
MHMKYEIELVPVPQKNYDPATGPSTFWNWTVTRLDTEGNVQWQDGGENMHLLHAKLSIQDSLNRALKMS